MSSKNTTPTIEEWKRLYELMAQIKELAPWEYMYEDDLFGIRFPGTDQLGFVSVMGNLGEHYSIAAYLGKKGFDGFWTMQEAGADFSPDLLLDTPQLQASFEDREILTPEDRKIINQLNLKYRGRQAWPQFRSYRPGCFPWYLEKEEAQILITALEQLLDVAPRFEDDPDLLDHPEDEEKLLVRMIEEVQWVDRYQKIEFPDDPPIHLMMNMEALAYLKTRPKDDGNFYIADDDRILRARPPLPDFTAAPINVPWPDGSQLFQFDLSGRQLRTRHALTGEILFEFGYDPAGLLIEIFEKTGGTDNATEIQRDANGVPTAIVSPHGQVTELGVDANGFVDQLENPANEVYAATYTAGGLMETFTRPGNRTSEYRYETDGRLKRADDALDGFPRSAR